MHDKNTIGEGTPLGIGDTSPPETFHLHTDMAERILIEHDGATYELVERGDGIALEEVSEDDGRN